MMGLLVLAAVQAASPPAAMPPVVERAVPEVRLDIPDEIAPAIVPYMRCLAASRGVPIRAPGHGAVEPPTAAVGADCTPVRAAAARNAETMLAAQHRGTREERAALIERTLAGVDGFANMSASAPPSERKPDAAQAAAPGDGLEVTTSFHAPPAINEAIAPYVDCFTRAVGEGSQRAGPVHADGMRRIIDQAKAGCAAVRAQARVQAIRLIANDASIASGSREAEVDRVLADIDRMGDQLVESVARADRSGGAER